MEAMSKQDKEISKSANSAVPSEPKAVTPTLKPSSLEYQKIISLINSSFGLPKKYTKIIMYDYMDRPDTLINIWVPDPNSKSETIKQCVILSYRYENGKVTKP